MYLLSITLLFSCRSKAQEDTSANSPEWWENDLDDSTESNTEPDTNSDTGEKPDDESDTGEKPDDESDTGEKPEDVYSDCEDSFDPTEPCQGDYTTTLCMLDGMFWWCDNGVWVNEDDK